ncbi:ferredoxin [Microtetraspora sp. AC03309]|uniref:ferredoxin n=1 Tax=Microtetraspora sp. AC03309 TaxID=2779376 RepID=UPI001E5D7EC4|nr:ferredoxin [Microtetraspora sp. AC03309]MCC5579010.1 ferredoxin [Microtetraspora sp. AC03309]
MKVVIDAAVCDGKGYCKRFAPEVFALDEWGYGKVLVDEVPPEYEANARAALEACPLQAIKAV